MEGNDTESLIVPTLFLVLLLACADLWAAHHFGFGIRNPSWLAVIASALGAGWGLVGWLFSKKEKEKTLEKAGRAFRKIILRPTLIQVLWAVFLMAALLFSSVTIVAEPGFELTKASVGRLSGGEGASHSPAEGANQVRQWVVASPLAGPYVVRADGYLPTLVEAAPLLGARIRLGRDVERSPSVLIRTLGSAKDALSVQARLRVFKRTGGDLKEIAKSEPGQEGSFLVGRGRFNARDRLEYWERELSVAGAVGEGQVNQHLLDWSTVHRLPLEEDLTPGDTLVIRVVSGENGEFASQEIVLEAVDILDLLLRSSI